MAKDLCLTVAHLFYEIFISSASLIKILSRVSVLQERPKDEKHS